MAPQYHINVFNYGYLREHHSDQGLSLGLGPNKR